MRGIPTVLTVAALVVVGAIVAAGIHAKRFLQTPLMVPEQGLNFEIAPGTAFATVSRELEDAGIVTDGDLLRLYARWTKQASKVQAGDYHIEAGTTPVELLQQFKVQGFDQLECFGHRAECHTRRPHPIG